MGEVGIRELKQNASAVVARAVEGETMTITDRGRPVAVLTGIERPPFERLVESGVVEIPLGPKQFWRFDTREVRVPEDMPSVFDALMDYREGER